MKYATPRNASISCLSTNYFQYIQCVKLVGPYQDVNLQELLLLLQLLNIIDRLKVTLLMLITLHKLRVHIVI